MLEYFSHITEDEFFKCTQWIFDIYIELAKNLEQ